MTIERRIVVGIEDIKSIILQCVKCKARVCRSPDKVGEIPYQCECGHTWRPSLPSQTIGNLEPAFMYLPKAIQTLRNLEREHPLGFNILFEFEEPR